MISCSTHPRNETAADPHTVSEGGRAAGAVRRASRTQREHNLCAIVFPVFFWSNVTQTCCILVHPPTHTPTQVLL